MYHHIFSHSYDPALGFNIYPKPILDRLNLKTVSNIIRILLQSGWEYITSVKVHQEILIKNIISLVHGVTALMSIDSKLTYTLHIFIASPG